MRRLLAPLLLAGCFSPSVDEGAECSPQGACPPGQTCAADLRCYAEAPPFRIRRRIDVHPTAITSALRDHTMAVVLRGDPSLAEHARDDGLDLHFTDADGTSELAFEVESFDRAAGDLVAWVRVPVLDLEDSLYLEYAGDPHERPEPSAAWHERYLAVWHGASAEPLTDSTVHHNDGQSEEAQAPAPVAGVAAGGLAFDGVDDRVAIEEAVPLVALSETTSLVVSMWVEVADGAGDSDVALGRGAQSGSEAGFGFQLGRGEWLVRLRGTGFADTLFASFGDGAALAGRWVLLGAVIVHRSQAQQSFDVTASVDGEDAGEGYWRCESGCVLDLGGPLGLGHPDAPFLGSLDEIRIVDRALGGENLRAEHENLSDPESFYTVGPDEAIPL